MQFSLDWIRQYVDLPDDPRKAAEALTQVGLAVELVEARETSSGRPDWTFDIDVTTNRPDAMNHVGLARELAVALGTELRPPEAGEPGDPGSAAQLGAEVRVEDPELCPRFTSRVIEDVRVGPSPDWLRERLESIGVRSINNVVDVTNFLLWEQGQPQHAYDLDTLRDQTIVVRRARPGESVETLDGEERELEEGMLLICDPQAPIGIAGVMGGLSTEVTEKTTRLLLESAWFDPSSVRQTSRRLGLHTDASHRFERGADFELALRANDRACRLIAEIAGGQVLPGAIDVRSDEHLPECSQVIVRPERISAFAGADIPKERARVWLEGLGYRVEDREGASWSVVPPSWRALDTERPADIYEEVIRHFGFDNIEATLPAMVGSDAPELLNHRRRRLIQDHLMGCGLSEAIDWSFHSRELDARYPHLVEGGPVTLQNPLSELYEVMRRSLLPGLVESALFNVRRGAEAVRLFEIGDLFGAREVEAVGIVGGGAPSSPWQARKAWDLFDLKGLVESLAGALGARLEIRPATVRAMIEGTSAELWGSAGSDAAPRRVGWLGQLDEPECPYPLFAAEILAEALGDEASLLREGQRAVEAPSRYPSVTADLTFTHALDVLWARIEELVEERREAGDVPNLERFELKDRYQGEGVPKGFVNTTLSFLYSSPERSLTQEEVNAQHRRLQEALVSALGRRG